MYIVKIFKRENKKQFEVLHYNHFENIVSDIIDVKSEIHEKLSEFITEDEITEMANSNPKIICSSFNQEDGIADDFEFRFKNDIIIYAGQIIPVDNH